MMYIANTLRDELALLLECHPDNVSMDKAFYEMGVDSMLGIRLIGKMNDIIGHEIDPVAMFDHPSINALAQYIHDDKLSAATQG